MNEFTLITQNLFDRQLKKLPRAAQDATLKAMQALQKDPLAGGLLSGNLAQLYSWHYSFRPEYRIVYAVYLCPTDDKCRLSICETNEEVESCSGLIDLIAVGSREEITRFYRKPRNEIEQWLRE